MMRLTGYHSPRTCRGWWGTPLENKKKEKVYRSAARDMGDCEWCTKRSRASLKRACLSGVSLGQRTFTVSFLVLCPKQNIIRIPTTRARVDQLGEMINFSGWPHWRLFPTHIGILLSREALLNRVKYDVLVGECGSRVSNSVPLSAIPQPWKPFLHHNQQVTGLKRL